MSNIFSVGEREATADQIEQAYLDPQIGPRKLVFGTDWGASISYHRVEGLEHDHPHGKVFAATPVNDPPRTLILHEDWALRQMNKIEMSEEHRAMILELNMARLCEIDVDRRLWEEQDRRYGPQLSNEEVPIDTGWERD